MIARMRHRPAWIQDGEQCRTPRPKRFILPTRESVGSDSSHSRWQSRDCRSAEMWWVAGSGCCRARSVCHRRCTVSRDPDPSGETHARRAQTSYPPYSEDRTDDSGLGFAMRYSRPITGKSRSNRSKRPIKGKASGGIVLGDPLSSIDRRTKSGSQGGCAAVTFHARPSCRYRLPRRAMDGFSSRGTEGRSRLPSCYGPISRPCECRRPETRRDRQLYSYATGRAGSAHFHQQGCMSSPHRAHADDSHHISHRHEETKPEDLGVRPAGSKRQHSMTLNEYPIFQLPAKYCCQ